MKIGTDVVDICRFSDILNEKKMSFFEKTFSPYEREYCFSFSNSAPHFAGIFAAKEAVSKALGVRKYPVIEIEIRHDNEGAPVAYYMNENLGIALSISHTDSIAFAVALK